MNWLINIGAGIKALFQKRRAGRELDEEIEGYLEASEAHKVSAGMPPDAARRAALVEMGSTNSVRQHVWESRWESEFDNLLQDLRLSIRKLLKSPGFTFVALVSLALGIGANAAIFTLIRQVLLQELPVRNPEQLVTFGHSESGGIGGGIDLGQFGLFPWYFARQLEENPGPFQGIAAFGSFSDKVSVRLPSPEDPVKLDTSAILVRANLVSGNYFHVLGAQAFIGRTIIPSDANTPGGGAVIVLSHHFWQQSFSSDQAVIGKTISINRTPFTVVGVMPESFQGIKVELEPTGMWTPVTMQAVVFQQPSFLNPRSGPYFLHIFGRLSPEAANKRSGYLQSQVWLNQQIHQGIRDTEGALINPVRQREIAREVVPFVSASHGVSSIRGQYGDSLRILMGVVLLILLIACANLANFLLARAASGQREVATRLALGSSRARIVRQNLVETLLLSLTGGLLGLGVAIVAARALIAFISRGTPSVALSSTPNLSILAFTLAVSLVTALLFGLAPALAIARSGEGLNLNFSTRTAQSGGGRSARFWPKALITAQVALSLVLLIGAGFFLRTLRNLQNQDYGFERTHLVIAQFNARLAGYKPSQTPALHQRLIEHLSALPGVRSVALAATPPISQGGWGSTISPPGYIPAPKENMVSNLDRVSADYFQTVGIPAVAGRTINSTDTATSLKVAVVNQTVANRYYPHGDAVGRLLSVDIDSAKGPWQIVGIVRDTKSRDPRNSEPIRMVYLPIAQIDPFLPATPEPATQKGSAVKPTPREENQDRFANYILLRTAGDPTTIIGELQVAVKDVDPNLPLLNVTTIQQEVSSLITHDELLSMLTGLFSVLALLLAAIGLYGVISHSVARRQSEIGIRLALGAQLAAVRWMVLRESLLLLAIGIALGLPLAVASTMLIKHQLFGLGPLDPAIFLAAITVVVGMTLFASWLPARRASRLDPIAALRLD